MCLDFGYMRKGKKGPSQKDHDGDDGSGEDGGEGRHNGEDGGKDGDDDDDGSDEDGDSVDGGNVRLFLGSVDKCLFTKNKVLMTDQRNNFTKVWLSEPGSLLGFICRSMNEELHRSKGHSQAAASLEVCHSMDDSS